MANSENLSITWGTDKQANQDGSLSLTVVNGGVVLSLSNPGGQATSRIFEWSELAQATIWYEPDLFGVRDEPLHLPLLNGLQTIGFSVTRPPED
jgi:hypothetical protein